MKTWWKKENKKLKLENSILKMQTQLQQTIILGVTIQYLNQLLIHQKEWDKVGIHIKRKDLNNLIDGKLKSERIWRRGVLSHSDDFNNRTLINDSILHGMRFIFNPCIHAFFTYDNDTDVTYCDICGESLYCGNLLKEIFDWFGSYPALNAQVKKLKADSKK